MKPRGDDGVGNCECVNDGMDARKWTGRVGEKVASRRKMGEGIEIEETEPSGRADRV